jgi:opacity protein-like surface antigen
MIAFSLGCLAQDKTEVFGGYSYLRAGTGVSGVSSVNTNGWTGSLTQKVNRFVGVTAEFNGNYNDNILGTTYKGNVHNFLFGPRLSYTAGKITPFAHALYGVSRVTGDGLTSQNSFAMAYGGGVDVTVAKRVALRLAQLDYVRTQFGDSSQNHFRYSTGVVLRF